MTGSAFGRRRRQRGRVRRAIGASTSVYVESASSRCIDFIDDHLALDARDDLDARIATALRQSVAASTTPSPVRVFATRREPTRAQRAQLEALLRRESATGADDAKDDRARRTRNQSPERSVFA